MVTRTILGAKMRSKNDAVFRCAFLAMRERVVALTWVRRDVNGPWGVDRFFGRFVVRFRDFLGNDGSPSGSILGSFWVFLFFVFFAASFFLWIVDGFWVPFGSIFS